jgi:hypothetical protein
MILITFSGSSSRDEARALVVEWSHAPFARSGDRLLKVGYYPSFLLYMIFRHPRNWFWWRQDVLGTESGRLITHDRISGFRDWPMSIRIVGH